MYCDYWKLVRRPFDERIDPAWFFASGTHQAVAVQLRSLVEEGRALALLVGSIGSGKSAVAAAVADQCPDRCVALTTRPNLDSTAQVIGEILHELHAGSYNRPGIETHLEPIEQLKVQLDRRREAGQYVLAFIDGCDELADSELTRLLQTLRELGSSAAFSSVVIGSADMLMRVRRQIARSDLAFPQIVLSSMAPADTELYVRHRMLRAGGDPDIFSRDALELVHELSGGLPRRINRLCDLCLLVGFSKNYDMITASLVWIAQAEARVLGASRTALSAPTRRWRPLGKQSAGI